MTKSGVQQMHSSVLQRAHDFRRNHVARDSDDEQLTESRVEDELWRHTRVAAAENRRVWLLAAGELGEYLLLYSRETRFTAHEALVPGDETRERLVRRIALSAC